jgi:hypothetical protein
MEIPIRYHLAIDKKPKAGNYYDVYFYDDPEDGLTKAKLPIQFDDYTSLSKTTGIEGEIYITKDNDKIYI